MSWINDIKSLEVKQVYSQAGEETIIEHILNNIPEGNKFFVDLGAGSGISNTRFLSDKGWDGLCVDMNDKADFHIIKEFITPMNVCEILERHNCPQEFDVLNVDIDSFDWDVTNMLLQKFSPRLICMEFNPCLPVGSSIKLKYEDGYTWDGTYKYGFSFGAGKALAAKHDYEIIFNHIGLNLFLLRKDLINVPFDEVTAVQKNDHPINNNAIWVDAIRG